MFLRMGVPQNGWFITEHPVILLKWMIWGDHHFRKPPYDLASKQMMMWRSTPGAMHRHCDTIVGGAHLQWWWGNPRAVVAGVFQRFVEF